MHRSICNSYITILFISFCESFGSQCLKALDTTKVCGLCTNSKKPDIMQEKILNHTINKRNYRVSLSTTYCANNHQMSPLHILLTIFLLSFDDSKSQDSLNVSLENHLPNFWWIFVLIELVSYEIIKNQFHWISLNEISKWIVIHID